MSPDAILTLAVIALMLACLAREVLAPDVIVFSALGVLLLADVLTIPEADFMSEVPDGTER